MSSEHTSTPAAEAQDPEHREAVKDAGRRMGTENEPQHLSADQPHLDSTDSANADSFPASDPLPAQSHID